MTVHELMHWAALEELDPWGQRREDWRFANLAAVLATLYGVRHNDKSLLTSRDFMPMFPLDPYAGPVSLPVAKPQQSLEDLTTAVELMVRGTNQAFAERGIF